MKRTKKNLLLVLSMLIAMDCLSQPAENWSQFRGANSLGIAPESATPPTELDTAKNLAWKTPLAFGLSSPCIFENRIFLTGYNPADSALITYCFDQQEGSLLWERKVFADTLQRLHALGSPATPTPVAYDDAVYVYFGAYGVLCYDLDGSQLWERRLPILSCQYGSSSSPIITDSLLILNRIDFQKPSILALNRFTGKTFWQHFMDVAPGTPVPASFGHATPVIWRDQIILHRGFELIALHLKDGQSAWSLGMVSTGNTTPIIMNDSLYLNCFYNFGHANLYDSVPDFEVMVSNYDANHDTLINVREEIPAEMAFFRRPELEMQTRDALYPVRRWARNFDVNKDGLLGAEEWQQLQKDHLNFIREHSVIAVKLDQGVASVQPAVIWDEKDYVGEVPSLLKVGAEIYMVMDGGSVICFDSKTGKIHYKERIMASGAYFASPLYANGNIYFASYNGKVTVVKPGETLNVIAQSNLHEKIGASPVALEDMLYIRTDRALYAFKRR